MRRGRPLGLAVLAVVAAVAVVAGGVLALVGGPIGAVDPSAHPVAGPPSAGSSPGRSDRLVPGPEASSTPRAPATPATPAPTRPAVALPALVGAIGDSLSAAVDASGGFGAQPQHSWIVGDDPGDGVESHVERIRNLGGDPATIDAFRPGASIGSARRQADRVLDAVADLPDGATAYVTFELGANDVCAPTLLAATDPAAFAAAAEAGLQRLFDGLPAGSHVVVLSVPDVTRLRELVDDVPAAQALHRRYDVCESVLSEDADADAVVERIRTYNATLAALCERLDGPDVTCRHDQAGEPSRSLFGAPFTLDEISSLDYFHPSLAGQARIADEVWLLTPWGETAD